MGKHTRRRRSTAGDDNADDDDIVSSSSRLKSMDYFLEQLFEKRGSTRESALSSIIEGFTCNLQHQFAGKNFATLMHRYLNSIKRGSSKEICLAYHAIGLLAITIGCGDNAHELYKESLSPLSQDLKSKSETLKILDCLAVVTFVGGNNSEDIERTMQIIWQFIHPILGSSALASKHSVAVLCSAISAWSFLLSTMEGWNLNYNYWQGAISFFLNKLDENEESVRVAACEALALILETGCLEKFSRVANGSTDGSIHEGDASLDGYSSVQELKDKIFKQVTYISLEASSKNSSSKATGQACDTDWSHLKIFKEGYFPEISVKIGGHRLTLSTWSQSIQENELLHDIFEFTPVRKQQLGNGLGTPYSKEVFGQFYLPKVRKSDCSQNVQVAQRCSKQGMDTVTEQAAHVISGEIDDGSEAA